MNIKKIVMSISAGMIVGIFSILPSFADSTLFTRDLPTANLNNDAGVNRSNVAWSNGNEYVSGDDFTIGNPGEKWIITGVRAWNIGHLDKDFFGDEFSGTTLYFGTGEISSIASDTVAPGSDGVDPNIIHTKIKYADNSDYQAQDGSYRQIWQNDFTNLSIPVDGGTKYYFAVDGTTDTYLWFNHASNAALSGSTQDGADNRWVVWSRDDLTTPIVCDSNGAVSGTCDGGWDKSSDINIQIFAHQVNPNSFDVPEQCNQFTVYNLIEGTNGSNVLNGTNGADLILAKGGSDVVNGKGGDDCIVAGNGSDVVRGGAGNDVILGGAGSDSLYGDADDDTMYGEAGSDSLRGGTGNDMLNGGAGSDAARGEAGSEDTCVAESKATCEL